MDEKGARIGNIASEARGDEQQIRLQHTNGPIAVEFGESFLSRMRQVAGSVRSAEIGGLLTGSFPRATTLTLRLDDCIVFERRAADGRRFELSLEQRARLSGLRRSLIEQRRQVLGFFRTDLRSGKPALIREDLDLLRAEFGRAIHVALLVKPEPPFCAAVFLPPADDSGEAAQIVPEFEFELDTAYRTRGGVPGPVYTWRGQTGTEGARRNASGTATAWIGWSIWAAALVLAVLAFTAWAPQTARLLAGNAGLNLQAAEKGGAIEVNWNRLQRQVQEASQATLSVTGAGVERQLMLNHRDLLLGRVALPRSETSMEVSLRIKLADSTELVQTTWWRPGPPRQPGR